ncbi:MAG: hypothetical protein ACREJU_06495 [Nitrospiraceae bacterium]
MNFADQEGEHYFCIRLSSNKDMYAYADEVEIRDGALVLRKAKGQMNFALAPGQWEYCYAASSADGSAVAVEHWIRDSRGLPSKKKRTEPMEGRQSEILPLDGMKANLNPDTRLKGRPSL